MDLTEMLDAGGYPSGSESGSGSEKEQGSDDEDEEMSDDDDESITSDDEEGAADKLDSFVAGLDSKKRKAGRDEDEQEGKKKKRVVLKERSEAYPEGEFVAVRADETVDGTFFPSPCRLSLYSTHLPVFHRQSQPRRPPLLLLRLSQPSSRCPPQVP
jgi:hypothetical protein